MVTIHRKFWLSLIFALLLMAVATAPAAMAQTTSAIQGRVTDSSGAVIPGCTVRVANEATGVTRNGLTAGDGLYRIPDLMQGKYEVRIEHPGFKTLVRRGIEVYSQSVLDLDLTLDVGETNQTVEVNANASQLETTESRISEVVSSQRIESLPAIGRGLMWLTTMTAGVSGKAEDNRSGNCCDNFSTFGSPAITTGGGDLRANFYLDGIALHYGDSQSWNLAFTPSLDAVDEMRVSTNPTSAEDGSYSGPQVQMVTRGGSNTLHGTGHYTFLDDAFNALPYGASSADVGPWYQRYFGGTVGGPVIKDRLFFFGSYDGVREQRAAPGGTAVIVETQEYADWVKNTRPNSVAAELLAANPPFKYANKDIVDVNGDGIPDIGTVAMDRPSSRTGDQYNARGDYQTKSGKDRFYGTFWKTKVDQPVLDVRPNLDYSQQTGATLISAVNAHSFTPNILNEFRFSTFHQWWFWQFVSGSYNIPCVQSDDGLGFPSTFSGACSYSLELSDGRVYDIKDTFSWNRGKHSWKFGFNLRRNYMTDPAYLYGDTPVYNFANVIDVADDAPYQETRNVDASTGNLRNPFVEAWMQQLSFFAQDSWKVRPNLTVNLGLRWDYHYPHFLGGIQEPRNTYGPIFTNEQVNRQGILDVRNQKTNQDFDSDLNNFGPRISIAWDPTGKGRTVIRGGFFLLYDEINSLGLYRNYYGNPPISSLLSAGPQYGIPIVYGVAPVGTRDFPVNPGLVGPEIDEELGVFSGTRPGLTGYPTDFKQPMTYDMNIAFQRQVFNDLAVTAAYHYRRSSNDLFGFNANRFSGDLLDGRLDRINPYYDSITTNKNLLRRTGHVLVFEATKRLAQGWALNGSYSYYNSKSNGDTTEVFQPDIGWAREEMATHNFKWNAIWDLPFLRGRNDIVGSVFGGWQLGTIWNFMTGGKFNPTTGSQYGNGGDFNADGQRSDRPDLPTSSVATSFSKDEWMNGAMSASIFPLPAAGDIRVGTLPRNYFTGPGYARIDASLAKNFPIKERVKIQFQLQASNLVNRVNIRSVSSSLTSTSFARANGFYPMRTVQMALKVIF